MKSTAFYLLRVAKKICFSAFCVLYSLTTNAQTIQYSRQTFPTMYPDAMQLVANVSGAQHLLCFTANKSPAVYIFNTQLQLVAQTEVPFKLKENNDIRILSFNDYYLLYSHVAGTKLHDLWKIDGAGTATSFSASFQYIVDSFLNRSSSTLQLVNQHNELFVVAHTYSEPIKKLGSTVIQLDTQMKPVTIRKVFSDFFKEEEMLQQALLADNHLLLLKTSVNGENGNSLDVIKIDLTTGKSITNAFNSGSHLYVNPAFAFNEKDSTLLVYSLLREPVNSARPQRTIYISQLNHLLQEQSASALLKSQFRSNTTANYLLLQTGKPCWITMMNNYRQRRLPSRTNESNTTDIDDPAAFNLGRTTASRTIYLPDYNQPTAIRFTMLNEQFKLVKDSVVANNKIPLDVQPWPFAQFTINSKAYLILVQNFTAKHKGLLMLSTTNNGQLVASDLRVYDRYEYLLPQLQAVGDSYFILPYTYKNEIGLVKIKME